jgi:hypothetical protein
MQQLQVSIGAASTGPREIADQAALTVDLGGGDELVRAVIYSEVLAPPKALRTGPDTWDL